MTFLTIGIYAQSAAMEAQRVNQQFQQQAIQAHRQAVHSHQQFMNMHIMRTMNTPVNKTSGKYKFNVVTTEGDTIKASKKLKISFFAPLTELTIKTKEGEKTFKPEQTKEIFIKKKSDYIRGIQQDSIWIFNTWSTTNVKFFGTNPEKELGYLGWFQEEGGPIRVIAEDNMEKLMQGYDKALKALNKGKVGHAVYYYIKENKKREKEAMRKSKTQDI